MSKLVVVAGPTAVGKGTLLQRVRELVPNLWISISATTRPPRPNEEDGKHYFFVSDPEFTDMVESGEMLEWAWVHQIHRYGTPKLPVLEKLNAGIPAILEIDVQGAKQVKDSLPQAHFVFIAPPSWDELERRLQGRGTEDDAEQQRRLNTAAAELAEKHWFDEVIVNDDLDVAAHQLQEILLEQGRIEDC